MAEKLVLVEDDEDIALFVQHIFSAENMNVVWKADGKEGLNAIKSEKPDLCILDIMLPSMTGLEILADIRKDDSTKDIPVLILSALEQEAFPQGFNPDTDEYMNKPFIPSELKQTVRSLLNQAH